ncbi:MAG: hypothetical protein HY731_07350 [Candidatus Tectomicrobia bacterium]|nr:hypothetical protein [Candidatus Tectomicrobia bacterium]
MPCDCILLLKGVFELRIDFGAGYRVYFGESDPRTVILLWGGRKGTQKRDMRKAQEYWREYRRRIDAEE